MLELHRRGIVRTVFTEQLSDDVETLCSKVGLVPDEIPQLLDVMYRESAMHERYSEFVRRHEKMAEYHLPLIRQKAVEHRESEGTLVQTVIPIPLRYLMALEGFLSEARRLVTHDILLVAVVHDKDASRQHVQLEELVKKLQAAEPIRNGDSSHQALLRQCAPAFAKELVDSAAGWLGYLKDHRDELEHRKTLARSYIEFYAAAFNSDVHGGLKIYSVEGERLLEFAREVVNGARALTRLALRHLSSVMPKGTMEARVRAQTFMDELRRELQSTSATAPMVVAHINKVTFEEVAAARARGEPEPRVFSFD